VRSDFPEQREGKQNSPGDRFERRASSTSEEPGGGIDPGGQIGRRLRRRSLGGAVGRHMTRRGSRSAPGLFI